MSAATNTRWKVMFEQSLSNDLIVTVSCVSLNQQFRAASIRLFVSIESYLQEWIETAAVPKTFQMSQSEADLKVTQKMKRMVGEIAQD